MLSQSLESGTVRNIRSEGETVHMSTSKQLELAESLSRRAHQGQLDKAGLPYIDHPRKVAGKLTEPRAQAVAWLHDVIEDTSTTENDLRGQFDAAIVDAVVALTRVKGEADEAYYARIRSNELARQVKYADIHDNLDPLRTVLLDPATAERLAAKYGKASHSVVRLVGRESVERGALRVANPKVTGSNPVPATRTYAGQRHQALWPVLFVWGHLPMRSPPRYVTNWTHGCERATSAIHLQGDRFQGDVDRA